METRGTGAEEPHPIRVGAVNPLVALSYDGSPESRALAAQSLEDRTHAPCLPGSPAESLRLRSSGPRHGQRSPGPRKVKCPGETTSVPGATWFLQLDVGEGAPDHDFVVSTPGSVELRNPL